MNSILPVSPGAIPGYAATPAVGEPKDVVEAFKAELKESAHVSSMDGESEILQAVKNYVDNSDPSRVNLSTVTKAAAQGDVNALNEYSIRIKDRTNRAVFFKVATDALVNTIKTLGQS